MLYLSVKLVTEIHAFLLHYQPENGLRQEDGIRRAFLHVFLFILRVIGEMLLLIVQVDGLQGVGLVA